MATAVEIDWPAELERMAREAEVEVLAKADEMFAKVADEHQRQTDGYKFDCRRWGDFLNVFIERGANGGAHSAYGRKFSTSLNIGRAKQIKLTEGHCFDRRGTVSYTAVEVSDTSPGSTTWGSSRSGPPQKGWHYEIRPNYPWIPDERSMFALDPAEQSPQQLSTMGYQEKGWPRLKTEGYPRPAEDDAIYFSGIGATIFAPAGMGQAVYGAILAEIANGYERPAIVDTLPKGEDREDGLRAEQG